MVEWLGRWWTSARRLLDGWLTGAGSEATPRPVPVRVRNRS
jgi:hypothetical protein